MFNQLRRLFASPIFADEEKTRIAKILNTFLWSAIVILLALILLRLIAWADNEIIPLLVLLGIVVTLVAGQILLRHGYVRATSIFLVSALWAILTYQAWEADGIHDAAIIAHFAVIIFSSLLLGWRFASIVGGLSIVTIWCFAVTEKQGLRTLQLDDSLSYARDISVVIILVGILIYLLVSSWAHTLQSARLELQERLHAEEKLQRQANYLSALNEISLGLLNRLELHSLLETILARACRLIETEDGLIELVLPDGSALRQEIGHGKFKKYNGSLTARNEGIVGSVWDSEQTQIVENYVTWAKRLPEGIDAGYTAVMGVPLTVGETVIGVLVVAHTVRGRTFTREQVDMMERFASLASLAIDNTRLYDRLQQELMERRNTESALHENEERMSAILASIPDMIFEIASDGTCLDFMASADLVPILPPSQFIQKNVKDMFPPVIAEQTFFALERTLATEQVHAFEYGLPPGEETQFFEARVSAISPKSAIMMVREISQRKWIETEREELIKELERKNGELERFTYTVSHDLKSPLITIKGFLGFLEQDATSGNVARLKSDIQRIASATDKMQMLLNELLELTRIGRLVNPSQNFDFGELVREAVELVHGRIQNGGIQVSIQENLPTVYGDRRRLLEVLQNLIDNAAKFMGNQENPRIEIGLEGHENGLPVFHVRDNGMGIDPAHHDRIFGLFNKLDTESEGTGIGLSLVKRIIDIHGGRIWVESEPQKGSTFLFTLQTQTPS